ncbi:AI-2E family transporter [Streptomyces radiopugnans]|uniref:AI-2E family transporter n=1 Tax=Streptomyces radiopugnans TaxID=403935 RepID=UPI003F1A764C
MPGVFTAVVLGLGVLLQLVTTPFAAYAVGRSAYRSGAPLALGRVVRLPPLVVLVVVLAGGVVAGVLGMLVAVPLTTSARIVARHLRT